MMLICILAGLGSLALILTLVVAVLARASEDGLDALELAPD
jgi:hypothetical protein